MKLGSGFYCSRVCRDDGPLYIFNGFYLKMRERFVVPGTSIHCYVVQFDSSHMTWRRFRSAVVGATGAVHMLVRVFVLYIPHICMVQVLVWEVDYRLD